MPFEDRSQKPAIHEMANALNAYFAAKTKDEMRSVLERHRDALLSRVATLIIKTCISQEANEARRRSLGVYVDLLENAGADGVEAALKRLDYIPRERGYIFYFDPKSGLR